MFCKRCGSQLEANDAFCPDCGAAIVSDDFQTVAAPRDSVTMRADYYEEPTVMADSGETQLLYDYEKTVASPGLYSSAGANYVTGNPIPPQPQQNPYADFQPNYPAPPAPLATAAPKKKSSLPIIIAAFAVVIAVAVAAFIFKDDIIGIFEKDTTASSSDEKDEESIYNEAETTQGYVFDSPFVTVPHSETTPDYQNAVTAQVSEIPTVTQPVITNPPITQTPATQSPTQPQGNPISGLNSSDPYYVANFYETALKKTNSVTAQRSFLLNGISSGNSDTDYLIDTATILIEGLLSDYSTTVYSIPGSGSGALQSSDIESCYAYSENGYTYVYIQLKEQSDGPEADPNTAGPVSRGIGTLGGIDRIANLLGAEISSGKSSATLSYSDAYIECVIDESTGKIISGEWHYTADVYIGYISGTIMGYAASLDDVSASVDYTVSF